MNYTTTPTGAAALHIPVSNRQAGATRESAASASNPELGQFPDVYEANRSLKARMEAIIGGTDERERVMDTTQFPWCATASLLITAADDSRWIGTGWFISPCTLATAGHCVYITGSGVPGRDGWVKRIQVIPGRNRDTTPFGSDVSTEFFSVRGWTEQGLESHDYGAIVLPEALPIGTEYFGFEAREDAALGGVEVTVSGYPGDKDAGTLWIDRREISRLTQEKVFYEADTMGGQSGGSVFLMQEGKATSVAIHTYGGTTANSGTRIHASVAANLEAWKR